MHRVRKGQEKSPSQMDVALSQDPGINGLEPVVVWERWQFGSPKLSDQVWGPALTILVNGFVCIFDTEVGTERTQY